MAFHKDLTGADLHEPKAHKTTHQNGGADEISVAGLSGELADNQKAYLIPEETGDYAADWSGYTPPVTGNIISVYNSNVAVLSARLYIKNGANWYYVSLT